MTAYAVRQGAFRPETLWRLADRTLVESQTGRRERIWPLSALRLVRIAPGTNRYVPDETVMRLAFRRGAVSLGSHSYRGVAHYEDQSTAFAGFARALCAEAALAAPNARFETGGARIAGVFLGAMILLGLGVAALVLVAVATGASGLGLDLASRLAFGLLLMIAVQPWISGVGHRAFDPAAIPADILPRGPR